MKISKLLICSSFLLFNSCSKDEPIKEVTNFHISKEIKDFGFFAEGSYWIYKDSNTNMEDSLYVTSANCEIHEYNPDKKKPYIYNSYESCITNFRYRSSDKDFSYHLRNYGFYTVGEFSSPAGVVIYVLDLDSTNTFFGYSKSLSSLQIFGYDFPIVEISHITYNSGSSYYDFRNYYFVKNIGVVRQEILDSANNVIQTFDIVRWHVRQ